MKRTSAAALILVASILEAADAANLLLNPGFEDGLDNWTTTGFAAIRTGDPPPYEGDNYLYGDSTPLFTASQTLDLLAAGANTSAIDSGTVAVHYGGWQAGWNTQTDHGTISIRFLSGGNSEIGFSALPSFYSNHTWVQQSGFASLPAGTRSIVFRFVGDRDQGSNNDSYLDAAYVQIVPECSILALLSLGGSLLLLTRRANQRLVIRCACAGS